MQPLHQSAYAPQVFAVDAVGAADGNPDRVYGDWIITSKIRQQLESVRIREKVLRVDLEPSDERACGHHLRNVRKPKTDAGPFSRVWSSVTGDGHVPSSLLRLKGAADDTVAVARRHVDP